MKSAYELALEKMDRDGIEPPSEGNLSEADRRQVEEIRRRAKAKVAELEILHRDQPSGPADGHSPVDGASEYARERERVLDRCEREIAAIRSRGRR